MDNQKTAQILKYGDVLYLPTIGNITELKPEIINSSEKGISVKLRASEYDFNSMVVHPCATTVFHKNNKGKVYCINKSKAITVQHQMRITELKRLKLGAMRSVAILNVFIETYFEK